MFPKLQNLHLRAKEAIETSSFNGESKKGWAGHEFTQGGYAHHDARDSVDSLLGEIWLFAWKLRWDGERFIGNPLIFLWAIEFVLKGVYWCESFRPTKFCTAIHRTSNTFHFDWVMFFHDHPWAFGIFVRISPIISPHVHPSLAWSQQITSPIDSHRLRSVVFTENAGD